MHRTLLNKQVKNENKSITNLTITKSQEKNNKKYN